MVEQLEKLGNKFKWIALAVALLTLGLILVLILIQPADQPPETQESTPPVETLIPSPFSADDFTYDENGFMTCLTGNYLLGIDVSYHQGDIDWQQVADSGIQFVMLRLGNRTVKEGILRMDARWEEYYQGAKDAGLKVGAYFYSQAISEEEARQEASFVLKGLEGKKLDLPVVFDWEIYSAEGRNAQVDGQTLSRCAIAFCQMVEQAGFEPMIYFNLDLANRLWDLEQMQALGYQFWLALYRKQLYWPNRVDMWQYTESGTVPGISEKVDIDLYFIYE